MPEFGFIGPTYTAHSANFNNERAMNLYVERDESGTSKSKAMLVGTPGHFVLATLPNSPVRALFAGDNVIYAVGGDTLYEVDLAGGVTSLGTLNSASTPAKIFSNGNQLLVVSGDEVFCDNGVGPVSVLTDGYVSATFLDGYFCALRNPTGTNGEARDKIFISSLFDGTTWDALDFGSRQGSSDRLVQIVAHNQQLWLMGQATQEVWYNSGNPDFPFERIDGSQVEIGAWPWTIAELDQSLFFVGSNARGSNVVYRTQGFIPKRISNHAVESAILTVDPTNIPVAYTYSEAGHGFYVLCLAQTTWVYDIATDLWHERGVWNSGAGDFDPHDGVCQAHLYTDSVQLIGSGTSGKIYVQAIDEYTYAGTAIRRNRRTPYVSSQQNRIFFSRLQVDMEMGTQASGTPTAILKWSDDGGHTFNTGRTVSIGAPGDYTKRAVFNRLGSGRNRVFDFTLPDHTGPVAITEAHLDAEGGDS
jgi:hypothetical protein